MNKQEFAKDILILQAKHKISIVGIDMYARIDNNKVEHITANTRKLTDKTYMDFQTSNSETISMEL